MAATATWEEAVRRLRGRPDAAELVRDAYYDDPLLGAAERYHQSDEWRAIRALLGPVRGSAVDVGAGRGIASFALAREGFRVTAVEPDPSGIVGSDAIRSLARQTGLPIVVVNDGSERLPLADRSTDLVFARAVLHHVGDLEAACAEFHRVLRPDGRLVAVREHVISRPGDLQAFLDAHPLHHLYGGENAFLLQQYLAALAAAGFVRPSVLGPLDSPINFAPRTLANLKDEISRRIPVVGGAARAALDAPGVWSIARTLLARFDRRPGRLYSFVCVRTDR
jgi:SAM-dependent methyltransferase